MDPQPPQDQLPQSPTPEVIHPEGEMPQPTQPSPESERDLNKGVISKYLETREAARDATKRFDEEFLRLNGQLLQLTGKLHDRIPATSKPDGSPMHSPNRISDVVELIYSQSRSGLFVAPDGSKLLLDIKDQWGTLEKCVYPGDDIDTPNPRDSEYKFIRETRDRRSFPEAAIFETSGSAIETDGDIIRFSPDANKARFYEVSARGNAYWGPYREAQDPSPNRDPLLAANERLEYFLKHADELQLVEPNQGGQTPPSSATSGTPPAAPSV